MEKDMEEIKPHSGLAREFYFWSGIIATIAYRIVIILNYYSAAWVKVTWYIGTVGFLLYFAHRFQISEKRSGLIQKYELDKKVLKASELNEEEKAAATYILKTLVSSKERWNYIFIFLTSGLALAAGIYLDFFTN